jgi:anti-anti-sigma factor
MVIASRTPEGEPGRCPVCGERFQLDPSVPPGDVPCPSCGCLVWSDAEGTEVVVRLDGKLVGAEAIERVVALIDAGPSRRVVFDLDGVEWISSEALGTLIGFKRRVQGRKGTLALRHLHPALREVFRITRLDQVFRIEA